MLGLRPAFKGPLILNSDFNFSRAQAEINAGVGDAVVFGRPFIANPDFPERLAHGLLIAQNDSRTWFTKGPEGYLDYPFVENPYRPCPRRCRGRFCQSPLRRRI
jgi:2,4-dienoyl-CoA reductase-like NADH-dependent reductase (Old Yellow Enzyme family)